MEYLRTGCQAVGFKFLLALLLVVVNCTSSAQVDMPILQIQICAENRQFSVNDLLTNPAMRPIKIARDVAYGWPMQYQAVPLLDLLRGLPTAGISTLEARAKDGFVSEIPWNLVARGESGDAVAW